MSSNYKFLFLIILWLFSSKDLRASDPCSNISIKECSHLISSTQNSPISKTPILYKAKNEEEAVKLIAELNEWVQSLPWENQTKLNYYDGSLEFNLKEFLPSRIIQLLDFPKDQYRIGPNCYNSVAYSQYQSDIFYFGTFYDYKKKFCRLKESNETLRAGDIGVIEGVYDDGSLGKEIHAFVYINEKISFTKNGPDSHEPYQLMSLSEIESFYEVPTSCRQPQDDNERKNCKKYTDFYDCTPKSPFSELNSDEGRLYKFGLLLKAAWFRVQMDKTSDPDKILSTLQKIELFHAYYETAFHFLDLPENIKDHYHWFMLSTYLKELNELISYKTLDDPKFQLNSFLKNFTNNRCIFELHEKIINTYYKTQDNAYPDYSIKFCHPEEIKKTMEELNFSPWWKDF